MNLLCEIEMFHLVEQKDEVDPEGYTQRQHSHVVEIPGKIILQETDMSLICIMFVTWLHSRLAVMCIFKCITFDIKQGINTNSM